MDNYYTFGSTLHGAIEIAEWFEAELWKHWGLRIKPDSSCVMDANAAGTNCASEKWSNSFSV